MMKKFLTMLLTAALLLTAFTGCNQQQPAAGQSGQTASQQEEAQDEPEPQEEQEQQESSESVFASLSVQDLAGNAVDASLFEGHQLTMVNIWATFCGPCLSEMPELGELAAEYAGDDSGVQIVGLVTDVVDSNIEPVEEQIEAANQIVEETGAAYTHLVPDKTMYSFLMENVIGVPTTYFVDEKGNIIGDPVVGANDKAFWKSEIESRLSTLEK